MYVLLGNSFRIRILRTKVFQVLKIRNVSLRSINYSISQLSEHDKLF